MNPGHVLVSSLVQVGSADPSPSARSPSSSSSSPPGVPAWDSWPGVHLTPNGSSVRTPLSPLHAAASRAKTWLRHSSPLPHKPRRPPSIVSTQLTLLWCHRPPPPIKSADVQQLDTKGPVTTGGREGQISFTESFQSWRVLKLKNLLSFFVQLLFFTLSWFSWSQFWFYLI